MRVVEWDEFARLPPGTLYSKREAKRYGDGWGLWEGLYVKGEMAGDIDHWEGCLVPHEIGPLNEGAAFDLIHSRSACEGLDPHHYAIFERDDLVKLAAAVQEAVAVL